MFFGIELKPCESFTQEPEFPLHITQAALGVGGESDMRNVLQCQYEGKTFVLGSLRYGFIEQLALDLVFEAGKKVTFFVSGPGDVHLTGYYVTHILDGGQEDDEQDTEEEDEDEEEEEEEEEEEDLLKKLMAGELDEDDEEDFVPEEDDGSEDDEPIVKDNLEEEVAREEKEEEEKKEEGGKDKRGVKFDLPSPPKKQKLTFDELAESPKKPEEVAAEKGKDAEMIETQTEDPIPEKPKKKKPKEAKPAEEEGQSTPTKKKEEAQAKKKEVAKRQATPFAPKTQSAAAASKLEATATLGKPRRLGNGIVLQDLVFGTGSRPLQGRRVWVKYIGTLADGAVFDKTEGKPFSFLFGVGEVIRGWDIGIAGMRVGGKRKLTIPPALAYGDKRSGPIPANSTLNFQIELVKAAQ